ncbi:MAG: LysE family translocator [Candidatus Levyibacteriota bacterium]
MIVISLITAFVLGLIGGAIPGPVLAAIFTEILQSGLAKSFRIIFIGMATETTVAFICLIGLASLHLSEAIFRIISLAGAGILLWLATQIWKIKKIDTKQKVHFSSKKIIAMICANGALWLFWITVAIPQAIILSHSFHFGGVAFLIVLEIGWLTSTGAIAFIFSRFRKWLSQPHIVPFMFKLCALAFVYFAVTSTYQTVIYFFGK